MDDWQLLQDYVARESDAAFRTLVNRYVNLVYSVALRQVRDAHLAEEVAQAVFILLARKARGFRPSVVLSGWLFRTTRFVASRAVRAEQRRQRREQEAFAMQQLTTPDDTWKRIAPALDEGLEHLGETDRNALLLRFVNDKSHRETAAALGVSEDAAKKRVTRALDKLRNFFAGRGISLSAAVLASAMTANAAKAATPEITASIVAKVIASGSAGAGILTPLVSQTLNAWRWAKLKFAGALTTMLVAIVGIGVVLLPQKQSGLASTAGDDDAPPTAVENASLASEYLPDEATRPAGRSERTLRLHVVARDTGEGVPNAQLAVRFNDDGELQSRFDLFTDEAGVANVRFPQSATRLDIGVLSWGWAARFAEWQTRNDPVIPPEYTLFLDRVTNSMVGWLRDERGQPVANAEVEMQFGYSDMAQREAPRERLGFILPAVVARSDQNGWWTCAVLDPNGNYFPGLLARHPDFAPTEIAVFQWPGRTNTVHREQMELLWAGKLVTTMGRALTLTGRVLDEQGQPIAGAQVAHQPASLRPTETETSSDGSFAFRGLGAGDFDFIVTAPGFAQEYRKVNMSGAMPPVEVRLKPGGLLRLRFVDERGGHVPDAWVALTGPGGGYSPGTHWSGRSGPDGRIEWNSAPPDRVLDLCASMGIMTRGIRLKADGQEHVIALKRPPLVTGRVVDADTGEPIAGVKAFPGYGMEDHCWERGDTWRSTNDTFRVRFTENKLPWRVRVEAEGYEAFVSEPLARDFSGSLDVALHRPDLSRAVRGIVVQADGQPAAGAEVALLTLEHGAWLGQARFAYREADDKLIVNADADGQFVFGPDPATRTAHTIIAVSRDGFARVRVRQPIAPLTIRLQPWGRVEGTIDPSAHQRPVDSLEMEDRTAYSYQGSLRLDVATAFRLRPVEGDRFTFEFVPPETFCIHLSAGSGVPYPQHHHTWVTIPAGETAKVVIAETGYRVKGRLVAVGGEGDWTKQDGSIPEYEQVPILGDTRILSRRFLASRYAKLMPEPDMPQPEPPDGLTYEDARLWSVNYWNSEAVRQSSVRMTAILAVAPDGKFESLEGVQPGNYRLQVSINGKLVQQPVTIPSPMAALEGFIDLGNVTVSLGSPPQAH